AGRAAGDPRARPPRVVFVLNGLDEVARRDADFARVPFQLSRPNVVWLCAGRPEGPLPAAFTLDRCTPLFGGVLPPMSDADIRGLLLAGTGTLRYDLLRLCREQP